MQQLFVAPLGTLVEKERKSFIVGNIPVLLGKGGGITCDGFKIEEAGAKYYDFILHYIDNKSLSTSLSGQQRYKMVLRLRFIERCSGG